MCSTSLSALVCERAGKPSSRKSSAMMPAITAPRRYARMDCEPEIQSSPLAPSMVSKPWSISITTALR